MEPRQHQSTSFLLWKNPGVRKQITPWGQIRLCLGVAQVRLLCFNLSKSGNSSGSSAVLEPGSGDSVGASPTDVLVRSDSPHQSPRDVASLLPPSPCQAKVSNSLPFCSDFQMAAFHCAASGSLALLHFSTWDPLITLLALCILQMIAAHSRALAGLPLSYEKYVGGKKQACRQTLWKFPGVPAGSLSSQGSEFENLIIP